MEDLSQERSSMSKSLQVSQSLITYVMTAEDGVLMQEAHFDTNVIVENVLLFANNFHALLLLCRCSLVASIKLKKCCIIPTNLEFVGVCLSRTGNRPITSKYLTYKALVKPAKTINLHSIKGLFY
jgi:hypothetical protein